MASTYRQRGVAIITVMLMVTLATIAVTAMVTQQQRDIYLAGNRQADVQAKQLALGGERYAVQQLYLDRRSAERGNSDSFEDRWFGSALIPAEGGTIAGCIVDMQGRFNLNGLVDNNGVVNVDQRDQLRRLLEALEIDTSKVWAIVDWLDADTNIVDADGAEDDYYSLRNPPYLPANRRFASLGELKLVRGFNDPDEPDNQEDYELLLPHVSALPTVTPININTATSAVIRSLADFVGTSRADSLTQWSDDSWAGYPECAQLQLSSNTDDTPSSRSARDIFENVTDFVNEINIGQTDPNDPKFENTDLITVQSSYFEARVDIELGPIRMPQFSLLYRNDEGIVTVLQRARGVNLLQISGK